MVSLRKWLPTDLCLVEEEAEQSKELAERSKAKKGTDWSSQQPNGFFTKMTSADLCLVEEEAEQSKERSERSKAKEGTDDQEDEEEEDEEDQGRKLMNEKMSFINLFFSIRGHILSFSLEYSTFVVLVFFFVSVFLPLSPFLCLSLSLSVCMSYSLSCS